MNAGSHALVALALFAAASLGGCTSDMDDADPEAEPEVTETDNPTTLAERACPDDSILTWETFGGPFMYNWCNGFHAVSLPDGERQQATLGVDFDTVLEVRHWAERIWARSGDHNMTMPPVGGPDDVEREMLGEWLACGAPTLEDM